MRRLAAPLLFAALLTPTLSLADGASPALWSLGGGVGWTVVSAQSAFLVPSGVYMTAVDTSIPGVSASLERRVGERTWLAFGLAGGAQRRELDPLPPSSLSLYTVTSQQRDTQGYASVGLRRVMTPAGAPVDFSIVGALEGGFAHASATQVAADRTETEVTYRSRLVGLSGGIAVDRTLVGSLSLRIATPLVAASYGTVRSAVTGEPDRDGTTLGVHIVVAPRLELRIAF